MGLKERPIESVEKRHFWCGHVQGSVYERFKKQLRNGHKKTEKGKPKKRSEMILELKTIN